MVELSVSLQLHSVPMTKPDHLYFFSFSITDSSPPDLWVFLITPVYGPSLSFLDIAASAPCFCLV